MYRELGAEGVVVGVLKEDGTMNMEAMEQLMEAADGMSVTLHRAFDVCRDPKEALEQAVSLGMNLSLIHIWSCCRFTRETMRRRRSSKNIR